MYVQLLFQACWTVNFEYETIELSMTTDIQKYPFGLNNSSKICKLH